MKVFKKLVVPKPAAELRARRAKLEEALLKSIKNFETETGLTIGKVVLYAEAGVTAKVGVMVEL